MHSIREIHNKVNILGTGLSNPQNSTLYLVKISIKINGKASKKI